MEIPWYIRRLRTIGPRACYDEGKRVAETLFSDYRRLYDVDTKIVRIFNTYGPHMLENDGRVVSNFIMQALGSKPLTIYGDGSQTRSFCYVDDLVNGLVSMMETDSSVFGPINLGNPREMTVIELAEMIIQRTGSDSKIIFEKLPEDDPVKRKPNIELAIKVLQWEPIVPIEVGIDRTIEYFKDRH